MSQRKNKLGKVFDTDIDLQGLEVAPSQVWGGIRLVPLLRTGAPGDLRLAKRSYDEDAMVVSVSAELLNPDSVYVSYVPHGLVVSWNEDGEPVSSFGTHLHRHGTPTSHRAKKDGKHFDLGPMSIRLAHRMVRREAENRLRLLPLHVAMEGYLAFHFGGPDVAWSEYSQHALHRGLSPRRESSISGYAIAGLGDALRVFEIHENQVGVLIFVSGTLASAFVVPHPGDYRSLHTTVIEDFYGELLYYHGLYAAESEMAAEIDADQVRDLADLRAGLQAARDEWAAFQVMMADGLLGRKASCQEIYRAGPFRLSRFLTGLEPTQQNHIGEMIRRSDGTLEYLKTFHLSAAQCRRAYLLSRLAEHGWNLHDTAASFQQNYGELVGRLEKAGFAYLLRDHVLHEARRQKG